jgi:hypothetical protein
VLPNIRPLSLPELAAFRTETKDLVQPFRQAMLRLSKDLNAAILSDASLSDVKREARFQPNWNLSDAYALMAGTGQRPKRTACSSSE